MKTQTNTSNDDAITRRFKGCRTDNTIRYSIQSPLPRPSSSHALARAYFRDLRAAEMRAWELTGGDYLISQ